VGKIKYFQKMSLLVKKTGLFLIFTLFTLQETSFFENILFFP
jgi:hypothetical protein